ncbi:MAG: glycosyltransferase family 4 protein [Acidimicrobiales bacterium]|nr:glycosyltransferase family 4 protein [Acidimicrobiales bacterium]
MSRAYARSCGFDTVRSIIAPPPGATTSPLRIAVLSPIAWRTPPRHYGPWELFASLLADGLVALGHDVTLFATGDSITDATLHATVATGWSEDDTIDPKAAECLHIAEVFERAGEFDIIHNGFDFLPLTYSGLVETPVVTTIHGFSSPAIVPVYERYDATTTYVAISDADRHPRLHYAATIHHGIDVGSFALDPEPGEHLLFFGRIHPDKGTAQAIAVAQRTGRRLDIAGIVQDDDYFRHEVVPHLDDDHVRYLGPVDGSRRSEVLGGAHALLHLIDFDEPFGLSVAEALACGTPVIAHDRGSMRELVRHGADGFLTADVDGAVAAVPLLDSLDRAEIRASARDRFDRSTMVRRYARVYEGIVRP